MRGDDRGDFGGGGAVGVDVARAVGGRGVLCVRSFRRDEGVRVGERGGAIRVWIGEGDAGRRVGSRGDDRARVAGRWGGVGGEKGRGMFRAETRGGCVSPTGDAAADVVKRRAERCDFQNQHQALAFQDDLHKA